MLFDGAEGEEAEPVIVALKPTREQLVERSGGDEVCLYAVARFITEMYKATAEDSRG